VTQLQTGSVLTATLTTNVYNPEVGAIVFDESTAAFYGYTNSSTWIPLGGSSQIVPTATVTAFAGSSAPAGWLMCDGSAVSRTTYASLFSAIGTTYGAGDGSTTFNLPNTQGVFVRGSGSQTISGVSYSGTLAAIQGDQMQGHHHEQYGSTSQTNGYGWAENGPSGSNGTVQIATQIGSPITDGTNGTPRTGAETRPANISLNYIIKE
jgi:microcystin-dependent protein